MTSDTLLDHQIREALAPPREMLSTADLLRKIHRRQGHRRHSLPLFAAAAALSLALTGGGAALADYLLNTVPVRVVSGQLNAGSSHAAAPAGHLLSMSLENAQAAAGFHILTLPASAGRLVLVQVRPSTPGSPTVAWVKLTYQTSATPIEVIEEPGKTDSTLIWNVKPYGLADTHTATIDGLNVVYSGDASATDSIAMESSDGVLVILTSRVNAQGKPLSVQQWVALAKQLS